MQLLSRVRDEIELSRAQTGLGPCFISCQQWVYDQMVCDVLEAAGIQCELQADPLLVLIFDCDVEVDPDLEADCLIRYEEDGLGTTVLLDLSEMA
jgi:hypothetical protein